MASIVKRKNRYSVVYTYKDDDGNQHQKWETFDTNADAKKRKTQIEFEQQSGTFIIPNATTVADLLEEYCSVYGVNNWAMSTYRSKKGLMKLLHKAFKVQGRRLRFCRFLRRTDIAEIRLGIEGCLKFLTQLVSFIKITP